MALGGGVIAAALAGSAPLFLGLLSAHVLARVLAAAHCLRHPAIAVPTAWRAAGVVLVATVAGSLATEYVKASWLRAFRHPSGAMYPLISAGDHIFVKLGVSVPKRGDVVCLTLRGKDDVLQVKRIVALSGDTVAIDGQSVIVNQTPLPRQRAPGVCLETSPCTLWEESNGGLRYTISHSNDRFATAAFGPMTVPNDSVFVMGDSRDNSLDSRHLGAIPVSDVFGTFLMVWLPAAWLRSQ